MVMPAAVPCCVFNYAGSSVPVLTDKTAWHAQGYLQSPEYLKINPCGTCVPH